MVRPKPVPPSFAAPSRLSSRYFDFDLEDWYWLILMGVLMYFAYMNYGHWPGTVSVLLVAAATMIRTVKARIYRNAFDGISDAYLQNVRKKVWDAEQGKEPPCPYVVDALVDKDKTIGLMRLRGRKGSFAVVILGDGADTTMLELIRQYSKMSYLAKKLRGIKSNVSVSFVFRSRPPNPWPVRDFMGEALNPWVAVPDGSSYDPETDTWTHPSGNLTPTQKRQTFLHRLAMQRQAVDAASAKEVTMAIVLTIHENTQFSKESIDAAAVRTAPVMRAAKSLVRDLRRFGVSNPRLANYVEMQRFLRTTWDSLGMAEYYDDEYSGRTGVLPSSRKDKDKAADPAKSNTPKWPLYLPRHHIRGYKDKLVIDGNAIGSIRATMMPEVIDPSTFLGVFSPLDSESHPMDFCLALVGQAKNFGKEAFGLAVIGNLLDTFNDLMGGTRRLSKVREIDQDLIDKEADISANQNRFYEYNVVGMWHTPADEPLLHRLAEALISDLFENNGLGGKVTKGTTQHLRVLWSTAGPNKL